eukprot:7802546-Alexandrium_andersonii.AAC.1
MGAPCETFSRARTGPPGPRPLRGVDHPQGAAQPCRVRAGPPWHVLRPPEPPVCHSLREPRGRLRHREPRTLQ